MLLYTKKLNNIVKIIASQRLYTLTTRPSSFLLHDLVRVDWLMRDILHDNGLALIAENNFEI
jgi:hypothetical protein